MPLKCDNTGWNGKMFDEKNPDLSPVLAPFFSCWLKPEDAA